MVAIREYRAEDLPQMARIWNDVVLAGEAFPQEEVLDLAGAKEFFGAQSHCAAAVAGDEVLGLYILHPNNVGRCGHICNASYAVAREARGRGLGEMLVRDSLQKAAALGFGLIQFNAVTAHNLAAHRLYARLGFQRLGAIPGGFRRGDGSFADIVLYWRKTGPES